MSIQAISVTSSASTSATSATSAQALKEQIATLEQEANAAKTTKAREAYEDEIQQLETQLARLNGQASSSGASTEAPRGSSTGSTGQVVDTVA